MRAAAQMIKDRFFTSTRDYMYEGDMRTKDSLHSNTWCQVLESKTSQT